MGTAWANQCLFDSLLIFVSEDYEECSTAEGHGHPDGHLFVTVPSPESLGCRQFVWAQQAVTLEDGQYLDGFRSPTVDDAVVVDNQFAKTALG